MITLKEINKLLDEVINQRKHPEDELTKREENKLKNQTEFYRLVKSYIETKPTEAYVIKEINRINKRLELIEQGYDVWKRTNCLYALNPKKVYNKEMGVPDLLEKLEALKFIYKKELHHA